VKKGKGGEGGKNRTLGALHGEREEKKGKSGGVAQPNYSEFSCVGWTRRKKKKREGTHETGPHARGERAVRSPSGGGAVEAYPRRLPPPGEEKEKKENPF